MSAGLAALLFIALASAALVLDLVLPPQHPARADDDERGTTHVESKDR